MHSECCCRIRLQSDCNVAAKFVWVSSSPFTLSFDFCVSLCRVCLASAFQERRSFPVSSPSARGKILPARQVEWLCRIFSCIKMLGGCYIKTCCKFSGMCLKSSELTCLLVRTSNGQEFGFAVLSGPQTYISGQEMELQVRTFPRSSLTSTMNLQGGLRQLFWSLSPTLQQQQGNNNSCLWYWITAKRTLKSTVQILSIITLV